MKSVPLLSYSNITWNLFRRYAALMYVQVLMKNAEYGNVNNAEDHEIFNHLIEAFKHSPKLKTTEQQKKDFG